MTVGVQAKCHYVDYDNENIPNILFKCTILNSDISKLEMFRSESRPKVFRTLALLCEDESLSDAQLKAYQTRLQEYRTFLEAVSRLANCGNVCITEEPVMIGDNGLLTGESLNALQHAGAISVYNTLQQNNWEYPVPEEGEVAALKTHTTVPDEFLDSEKPIRSDWPAVHISECFIEGEKAKLHGSARPLRSFLPPSVIFRNAADIDDDLPEPELPVSSIAGAEGGLEIVSTNQGLAIRIADKRDVENECIPINEYYYGRQDCAPDYNEEKTEYRFKCAVCQRMFYSNIKLMNHIMGHVDEKTQTMLGMALNQCRICNHVLANAFDLRAHIEKEHRGVGLIQLDGKGEQSGGQTSNNNTSQMAEEEMGGTGFTCRICAKETASDLALAHHLQSTHRQKEMPYVCRLCLFRSSLYEDILDHFKKAHNGSNHLLCTYCLRVFTPSDARVPCLPLLSSSASISGGAVTTAGLGAGVGQTQVYLQHLRMHQVRHQLRRCPACRLNFTNKSDYQVHRRLDHKACIGLSSPISSGPGGSGQLAEQHQRREVEQQQQLHVDDYMTDSLEPIPQPLSVAVDTASLQHPPLLPQPINLQPRLPIGKTASYKQQRTTLSEFVSGAGDCQAVTDISTTDKVEEENKVVLLNAPEPSRTKDLSDTILPPEAAQMACLECGDNIISQDHKQYLPCSACVFATCCATAFARHIHRAHIYNPDCMLDSHTGSPMVRPVAFQWMLDYVSPVDSPTENEDVTKEKPTNSKPMDQADEKQSSTSVEVKGKKYEEMSEIVSVEDGEVSDTTIIKIQSETVDIADVEKYPVNNQQTTEYPTVPIMEPQGTVEKVLEDQPMMEREEQPHSEQTVMTGPFDNEKAGGFACPHCALRKVDGNTLARHLVEDCDAQWATLQPDSAIVLARQQAEEHLRMQQEQQAAQLLYAQENGIALATVDGQEVTGMDAEQIYLTGGASGVIPTDADTEAAGGVIQFADGMPLVVSTEDGHLPEGGATIDFTNAQGEVVQRLVLPEDLHLEPGQTLVLIQGEDGQPQFAIVNQAEWDAQNQQIMMQPEDDTNNLLLYENQIEAQRPSGEEEKENQFA